MALKRPLLRSVNALMQPYFTSNFVLVLQAIDAPSNGDELSGPLGDFSDMKKKKKPKKAAFDLEAFEKELEDASKPAAADGDEDDGGGGPARTIDYDEEDLGEDVFAAPPAGTGGELSVAGDAVEAWHGTDRDYTYAEVRALTLWPPFDVTNLPQ
jgi:hypothetical protein